METEEKKSEVVDLWWKRKELKYRNIRIIKYKTLRQKLGLIKIIGAVQE